MNPYLKFVESIEAGVASAKAIRISVDALSSPRTESDGDSASTILLFSPHPDDECVTGALPLRLMREMGKPIINVPVTHGSNVARQAGRAAELANACGYLGWEIFQGSENLQPLEVGDVVRILSTLQPEIIFMPHSKDWNSTHISTHFLVVDALKQMDSSFACTVVETETWGAMEDPNLMVEADAQTVADLVAATSLHTEEVARNPYHILLPVRMLDNVQRGAELVGGQGCAAPEFSFATLYRLRKWQGGGWVDVLEKGKLLPMGTDHLRGLFS